MERKRKSEKMSKAEFRDFKKFVWSFHTKLDACEALEVSRPTLDALLFKGSGKPETLQRVREKMGKPALVAA